MVLFPWAGADLRRRLPKVGMVHRARSEFRQDSQRFTHSNLAMNMSNSSTTTKRTLITRGTSGRGRNAISQVSVKIFLPQFGIKIKLRNLAFQYHRALWEGTVKTSRIVRMLKLKKGFEQNFKILRHTFVDPISSFICC